MDQCTPAKKKECAKGCGPSLEAVCATCPRKKYEPSPWMLHMWRLYCLQQAGYPFGKDDLDEEEWFDLGALKDAIEAVKAGVHGGR